MPVIHVSDPSDWRGNINIAPIQLRGECGNLSFPIGEATINATGSLGNEDGSFSEPSCGVYNYTASGGFFGRELRMSGVYTSRTCLNMNITINMTR